MSENGGGLVVATVLRARDDGWHGGYYDARWVQALREGLRRNAELDYDFVCLTDSDKVDDDARVPLEYDYPGWWAKMELLRPGLFDDWDKVLYVDLDSLIVGGLSEIASYAGEFATTRGFYNDIRQSAVMVFRPGYLTRHLWNMWMMGPHRHMKSFRGDGRWLDAHLPKNAGCLMDLYPAQIVSVKLHAREEVPRGTRIVCGHGDPRFDDPASEWAHDYWSSLWG